MNKTLKRELAFVFFLLLSYTIIFVGDVEMVKVIIWPIMLYIGAAFGMDWATKQGLKIGEDK